MLRQAMLAQAVDGLSQKEAAEQYGVDERELRDYEFFEAGIPLKNRVSGLKIPTYQHILDAAYEAYCQHSAIRHIRSFIEDMAPLYGVPARPIIELWEVCPDFYPSSYEYRIK